MADLSDDAIQDLLDAATKRFEGSDTLVSVEYRLPGEFVCTFTDGSPELFEAEHLDAVDESGNDVQLPLRSEIGPQLAHQLGRVGVDPVALTVGDGRLGGDECRNANSMGFYGTISFYGTIQLISSGACTLNCTTSPALVSNNHVIARSDAAAAGEAIWTSFNANVAQLKCYVPLRCNSSTDIAAAAVPNLTGIQRWNVRGIGTLAAVRRPNIGEAIRKHGARTGLTNGTVTGKANIKVNGRMYYGVFSTSGGFGCPGDSGSAVIAANGDVLGLYSWGQDIACSSNPVGYFFPLTNPGTRNSADVATIAIEP